MVNFLEFSIYDQDRMENVLLQTDLLVQACFSTSLSSIVTSTERTWMFLINILKNKTPLKISQNINC